MTLIIPPGYAQCVLHWSSTNFESGAGVTTFGMGEELGPDPTSYATAAALIADRTVSHIIPNLDNNIVLATVEVYGASDGAIETVGTAGASSSVRTPPNVACLVNKNVGGRGRRRQGRMFWPGLLANNVVDETGLISGTARTALQTMFDTWFTSLITGVGSSMVVLQNEEGQTPPISPPPIVSGLTVEARIASQRRRLRR